MTTEITKRYRLCDLAAERNGRLQSPVEVLTDYFSPRNQYRYVNDPEKAFNGASPRLSDVADEVGGYEPVIAWLCTQLYDLANYCGARHNFSSEQVEQTAQVLAYSFNLRLSEYMYFFFKFKAGEYGGANSFLNGTIVCNAVRKFLDFEANERFKIAEEEQKTKRSRPHGVVGREAAKIACENIRRDGYPIFSHRDEQGNSVSLTDENGELILNHEPSEFLRYMAGEIDTPPTLFHPW